MALTPMVSKLYCCALSGLQVSPVELEVDLSNQLPTFSLVGMASAVTQESRDRVRAAVTNSLFLWPQKKVTMSLTPSDVPKWGAHFELPMALGVLAAQADGPVPPVFAFGEVSLSGELKPSGLGASVLSWFQDNRKGAHAVLCHPQDWEDYLAWCGGELNNELVVITATTLRELWEKLVQKIPHLRASMTGAARSHSLDSVPSKPCLEGLRAIRGESLAKLAILVALADSRRHVLLAGPQGTGKSMAARALAPAVGPLGARASAELATVNRALGLALPRPQDLRPVMYLQSSATKAALEGAITANGQVVPGEMSRAHGGVLVMDELLECRRDTIECLRQPLEEGLIRLQRARHRALLPARFQFVATTNLCPCGLWLAEHSLCCCGDAALAGYQRKLSGPILDRFSMIVLTGQGEQGLMTLSLGARALLERWTEDSISAFPKLIPQGAEDPALCAGIVRRRPEASLRAIGNMAAVAAILSQADGGLLRDEHIELAAALRFPIDRALKRGRSALPPLKIPITTEKTNEEEGLVGPPSANDAHEVAITNA